MHLVGGKANSQKFELILHICVQYPPGILYLFCFFLFFQHIPIWILNSATPTILGQITHKPSLPPHLVGFLLSCMAWWEMMISPGEQWSFGYTFLTFIVSLVVVLVLVLLLMFEFVLCKVLSITWLPTCLSLPSLFQGASQSFDPPRLHRSGIQHCWRRGWRGNLHLLHPGRRASWPQWRAAQGRSDPQCKDTFIFIKLSRTHSCILQRWFLSSSC